MLEAFCEAVSLVVLSGAVLSGPVPPPDGRQRSAGTSGIFLGGSYGF